MAETKKLNRIKVVLAEKDRTGRWLAAQVGKSNCTYDDRALTTNELETQRTNAVLSLSRKKQKF